MLKKISAVFICIIFFSGASCAAEQVKLLSYYPSPSGYYNELKAKNVWVGVNSGGSFFSGGSGLLQVGGTTTTASRLYVRNDSSSKAVLIENPDSTGMTGIDFANSTTATSTAGGTAATFLRLYDNSFTELTLQNVLRLENTRKDGAIQIVADDARDPPNDTNAYIQLITCGSSLKQAGPLVSITPRGGAPAANLSVAGNISGTTINGIQMGASSKAGSNATYIRLTSPGGTKYYVYVDDSGNLITSSTEP